MKALEEYGDIFELRAQLAENKKKLTAANTTTGDDHVVEKDHNIPTRDSSQIVVRTYSGRPSSSAPVLVMLHGGGWCLGDLDNETLLCRRWCEDFGGVAFNIAYRLAPEHKFPTAVYDSYDALLWVMDHATQFGGSLEAAFIVGGVSAGRWFELIQHNC